jgi:FlaA1/EpsC-like NDP-sugar epimerase
VSVNISAHGSIAFISFAVRSRRCSLLVLAHLTIWSLALALAYGFRFDFDPAQVVANWRGWTVFSISLTGRLAALFYFKLHEISWRHISTKDITKIIKAHLAAAIVTAAFLAMIGLPHFPRSVIILYLIFSIIGCAGLPLSVRMLFESLEAKSAAANRGQARETIVLGAGESGHLLVKTLQARRQLPYVPIGILDDSPAMRGRSVYGVEVFGRLNDLQELLEANPKVGAVLLAIPSLSKQRVAEIEKVCKELGVAFKKIQSFEDIALTDIALDGGSTASIESVLERDVSVSHDKEIREFIAGKDVAVTGAGGSIGSELVRQLVNFGPKSVTLIDSNEFHMFKIQRELNGGRPEIVKRYCVASIVDEGRMLSVFGELKPQVVFHAAAYKHVPLMEENPYEAFQNNVVGTRNLLRACAISGIEQFIMISTDKAVNSCSVMGHSKRIGELLVQDYVAEATRKGRTFRAAVVRFGNVINSNGSVVPLFKEQILSGGPVTVTHPEMRRFFMSIREAVRLVLAAGSIGSDGEVFLLDMGSPVKIVDVAKKMLALYGRRDIEIVFSGIRPGERLYEELTGPGEETFPTPLAKVQRVIMPSVERGSAVAWVAQVEQRLMGLSGDEIRGVMADFVAGGSDRAEVVGG